MIPATETAMIMSASKMASLYISFLSVGGLGSGALERGGEDGTSVDLGLTFLGGDDSGDVVPGPLEVVVLLDAEAIESATDRLETILHETPLTAAVTGHGYCSLLE